MLDAKATQEAIKIAYDQIDVCLKKLSYLLALAKNEFKIISSNLESDETDRFKDKVSEFAKVIVDSSNTLLQANKFLNNLSKDIKKYNQSSY